MKVATKYGKTTPPSSSAAVDLYSYWFEQAYPQPGTRQEVLRELMEKAYISPANFRLAHLVLTNSVTNLVVTTNFDDLLSRALTLFGVSHIICDHPRMLERFDPRFRDTQIVHVHGSYRFYDCCNLGHEIAERARGSQSTSFTMLAVLDDVLRVHSPLVVGYSGWEGDVFMTALKRRLSRPLASKVYWFCYKRKCAENLPEWLITNSDVCIVVPNEEKSDKPLFFPAQDATNDNSLGFTNQTVLSATTVFDELIREFAVPLPTLTKDPLGFFSGRLKQLLTESGVDNLEGDTYAIRSVIERVERAREREARQRLSPTELHLESFRDAVWQSNPSGALDIAGRMEIAELSADALKEVAAALVKCADGSSDNPEAQLSAYDLVLAITEEVISRGLDKSCLKDQLMPTLANKGSVLAKLGRQEEAVSAYEQLLRTFDAPNDAAVSMYAAKAFLGKAAALQELDRDKEAFATYDEFLQFTGDDLRSRLDVARSLTERGGALLTLNRSDDALSVYDEFRRRFGECDDRFFDYRIAVCFHDNGVALALANRNEEAVELFDLLLARFGKVEYPHVRYVLASALVEKGIALGKLGRPEEAISVYEKLQRRFGGVTEPGMRALIARALLEKAVELDDLARVKDAIAAYDEVLTEFRDTEVLTIRRILLEAMHCKALALTDMKCTQDAIVIYGELLGRFADSQEPELRDLVELAAAKKTELECPDVEEEAFTGR